MVCIRQGTIDDILEIQQCNLYCLPENYGLKYYMYHILTWPQLQYVAISNNRIVGYVMGKMNDENDNSNNNDKHGHITSLAVARPYRKLGLATQLMNATQYQMRLLYNATYCSLHVRISNAAAVHLYSNTLKFTPHQVEHKYYADGEDAYDMRHYFDNENDSDDFIHDNTELSNNNVKQNTVNINNDNKQQTSSSDSSHLGVDELTRAIQALEQMKSQQNAAVQQ